MHTTNDCHCLKCQVFFTITFKILPSVRQLLGFIFFLSLEVNCRYWKLFLASSKRSELEGLDYTWSILIGFKFDLKKCKSILKTKPGNSKQ